MSDSLVTAGWMGRFALRLTGSIIRATVPPDRMGVYLLLDRGRPAYVGRSDHCVRTRLLAHPLRQQGTHFVWQPTTTAHHAFVLEAAWFHHLRASPEPSWNEIHPARPDGRGAPLPVLQPR